MKRKWFAAKMAEHIKLYPVDYGTISDVLKVDLKYGKPYGLA